MTSDEMQALAKRVKKCLSVSLAEQHVTPGPLWFMPLDDTEKEAIIDSLNAASALRALSELPPRT